MEENKNLNNQPEKEEEKKKKKCGFLVWWHKLSKGAKIGISAAAGIVLTSAILFPTLAATIWKKGGDPVKPEPELEEVVMPWSGAEAFDEGSDDVPSIRSKLNSSYLFSCNFAEPAAAGYTSLTDIKKFYTGSQDPASYPTFEKFEVIVNNQKVDDNKVVPYKDDPSDVGYRGFNIDASVTSTFNENTVVKIKCINCNFATVQDYNCYSFNA